jgi:hypothetical protein
MVLKGNLLIECNTYFHRNFYITNLKWYSSSGHIEKRDINKQLFGGDHDKKEKELFETI